MKPRSILLPLAIGLLPLAFFAALLLVSRRHPDTPTAKPPPLPSPAAVAPALLRPFPAVPAAALPDLRAFREHRVTRAEQTLSTYLESARYPPFCRPMSERPDLSAPHHVPARRLPLAHPGGAAGDARVILAQDRFEAAGDERVTLSISCERGGVAATCEVLSATAEPAPDMPPAGFTGRSEPSFAGAGGGRVAAVFQPSVQGFPGYHGPIRVAVALRVGLEEGSATFDVAYTSAPPATFTGAFREALAGGSLDLHAGVTVRRSGRYLIRARVDDADGKRFAYLAFDGPLGAGPQEATLRLFGKVVTDQAARPPFRVRDLEGFRFEEDAFPDRESMPALEGAVYTTGSYPAGAFSAAEWESPQKARRVEELTRGVDRARRGESG